jgi:hypothetical protein
MTRIPRNFSGTAGPVQCHARWMGREPVWTQRAMTGVTDLPTAPPAFLACSASRASPAPMSDAPDAPDAPTGAGRRTDAELIAASRDSPDDLALVFDRHAVAIHRYIARRLSRTEADAFLTTVAERTAGTASYGPVRRSSRRTALKTTRTHSAPSIRSSGGSQRRRHRRTRLRSPATCSASS